MARTWDEVETELTTALAALEPEEFLVVGEPAPAPGPARGLLRRRSAPPPHRYVQFRATGEWVYAECVGSTVFGGDWPSTAEQHDALRDLGWLAPGDEDPTETRPGYPNYWRTLPRAERAELALLGARSLSVLGVEPTAVHVERGSA